MRKQAEVHLWALLASAAAPLLRLGIGWPYRRAHVRWLRAYCEARRIGSF